MAGLSCVVRWTNGANEFNLGSWVVWKGKPSLNNTDSGKSGFLLCTNTLSNGAFALVPASSIWYFSAFINLG